MGAQRTILAPSSQAEMVCQMWPGLEDTLNYIKQIVAGAAHLGHSTQTISPGPPASLGNTPNRRL